MRRGEAGSYEVTMTGDEQVRAFVPLPLPPEPPLALDGSLQQTLEAALLALGRLDGITTLLPDQTLFLYTFVRKEAVLSSQIEGTQSSLSDLLLFELEEAPGVPIDDVVEVSNYVAALEHGLRRLREGFPLSNRLLREIHGVLLSRGRGSDKMPGEFRRSQNWIGGSRPGNADFVPPPYRAVPDCMAELERFLHAREAGLPLLLRAGLAHVQFETIHPFLDGNGRVGRLLVTLLLCQAGVLREPLLYLSLYFKQHRDRYYDLLNSVRQSGDWEEWLAFFLEGVRGTAAGAFDAAQQIARMFQENHDRIETTGRRAGSAVRVHEALKARPILSLLEVCKRTTLSFPTATRAMELLVEQGIAREITGKRRNRLFMYDRYLAILDEGTEPVY
ncbi:MAG: Fic family protein [Caldilineaceae bacterium SB0670_bin_27]|uniref:Fic family protein n=1 Tax=Caldilineaceae bacterium SB0664_bin_27 TaxID=2605260 RepID=A0A6B0YVD7_9CHLR|nr:Fic family protein [Caldilineaceae bacterium SB0664_bin_27]MYJ77273.1 Fic family protein [Caldilineaceae bacterium SB0670_bin_27]